ncbi:cAMP-independent regulatory protein pac2 [Nannizzia gypsea CBS 118893]|uniref:cAMP-independent regulatory protein pac2 n=1 Tax=Arthroderma gypseum (strain ATCC MYA-4604 / CBS 118893) TaxID=535722 RepID=E4UZE6_ARTGP|nr:cAMP-independent regulatory protein pac2 [Nannizzia gypsea CBS 118893]EFR03476.1 cAMP-independent regulatory protein pac2 [Nannizzia gypsea CBS 118893]
MGNGSAAVLEPTYTGYVASTHDALILFEACLTGVLHHVPRRPHDRERAQLVRSGSVFIYEENASGIKRWTDGVTWSPSRILGNFLVYRELDKPFPPGEKKRAVKKGSRRPTQSGRAGEPYPRLQDNGTPVNGSVGSVASVTGSAYSPGAPSPIGAATGGHGGGGPPGGPVSGNGTGFAPERGQQSELERALVGSLVDSYGFKDSGLVKKTMSVTVSGVTHHLVSYYSVDDVMRGALSPPSMVESLRYIRPRQELTTKQSFRAPIEDPDQPSLDDGDPSQSLYGYRPNPAAAAAMVPQYGMPQSTGYYAMPPQPPYSSHHHQQHQQHPPPHQQHPQQHHQHPSHQQQQHQQHHQHPSHQQHPSQQPPPPSVPGYGVAPPQQNPYLQQSPATAASDLPSKSEEYASYRGPSAAAAYQNAAAAAAAAAYPPSSAAASAAPHIYRTPSIPTRPGPSDMPPTSLDPAGSPNASTHLLSRKLQPARLHRLQARPTTDLSPAAAGPSPPAATVSAAATVPAAAATTLDRSPYPPSSARRESGY